MAWNLLALNAGIANEPHVSPTGTSNPSMLHQELLSL
jgi:hypothetical protein